MKEEQEQNPFSDEIVFTCSGCQGYILLENPQFSKQDDFNFGIGIKYILLNSTTTTADNGEPKHGFDHYRVYCNKCYDSGQYLKHFLWHNQYHWTQYYQSEIYPGIQKLEKENENLKYQVNRMKNLYKREEAQKFKIQKELSKWQQEKNKLMSELYYLKRQKAHLESLNYEPEKMKQELQRYTKMVNRYYQKPPHNISRRRYYDESGYSYEQDSGDNWNNPFRHLFDNQSNQEYYLAQHKSSKFTIQNENISVWYNGKYISSSEFDYTNKIEHLNIAHDLNLKAETYEEYELQQELQRQKQEFVIGNPENYEEMRRFYFGCSPSRSLEYQQFN